MGFVVFLQQPVVFLPQWDPIDLFVTKVKWMMCRISAALID